MEETPCAPRVLLIDDHALFRTGVGLLLADHWPEAVLVEAGSLDRVLMAPQEFDADLVVLDLQLPGLDGLSGLRSVRLALGGVPVVVVSSQGDDTVLRRAREEGAAGFVSKSVPADVLADGLRRAWQGQAVWLGQTGASPRGARISPLTETTPDEPDRATPLQRRMLALLPTHRSNKALSKALALSEQQVRAEMSVVMERLGVISRDAAWRAAQQLGWLGVDADTPPCITPGEVAP